MNDLAEFLKIKFRDGKITKIKISDIKVIDYLPEEHEFGCEGGAIRITTSVDTYYLNVVTLNDYDYYDMFLPMLMG